MTGRWTGRTGMAALCGALLAGGIACAGGDTAGDSAADTTMPTMGSADSVGAGAAPGAMGDPEILAQVSVANAAGIAAGTVAAEKARDARVKEFARLMITEHTAMQAQADSFAMRASLAAQPDQPDTLQRKLDRDRQALQDQAAGADFDRLYVDMQLRDHEATLGLLNAARTAAQHEGLRTLVEAAIPKVQQHLDQARQLRAALGSG